MWVSAYDTLGEADLSAMRDELSRSPDRHLLSLVVPIADASEAMLEAFVNSLWTQVYERWEVNFIISSPTDGHAAAFLAQLPSRDSRFRRLPQRTSSLAGAWNTALRSSASEFVVLVRPSVSLRPHALFLIARAIERDPDAVLIYGDEDAIGESGSRHDHYFKPDWNEALLRSQNYLGDLVCFRRSRAPVAPPYRRQAGEREATSRSGASPRAATCEDWGTGSGRAGRGGELPDSVCATG